MSMRTKGIGMTVQANSNFRTRQLAAKVAPFMIVALAGVAVRTPLATSYPFAALLVFLWIVSDTLMLSLMARTSGRPAWPAILGVMAGASFSVLLASPPPLREVLWATPILAGGMSIIMVGHVAWATVRARRALNEQEAQGRWVSAASMFLPSALIRLATAELTIIHMAFFRWGGSGDVPANCRAFTYHKHLAPMCAMLLILSAIEIAVYHLLVAHWSRTAAVVMFIVSDIGFIYLVGLIKSFRFRPVLVTPDGVRIRTGLLIDQCIPLDAIAGVETNFSGEIVRDTATLNAALLAWPNVLLRLDRQLHRRSLLKKQKAFSRIAFRLDDPEPFIRLLLWRLGSKVSRSPDRPDHECPLRPEPSLAGMTISGRERT